MDTQAETYADHFILVHLNEMAKGMTYAQLSTACHRRIPTNTKLSGEVATVFKGDTLRSMLLNAYGWWQVGTYALYAGFAMLIAALVVLGAFIFEVVSWRKSVRARA